MLTASRPFADETDRAGLDGVMPLMRRWTESRELSGASWTDAYLAAFATQAGLRFATLDKGALVYPIEAEPIE